jgi:UDPglucose--hexose-1-phosphate uridylyltransferase
MRPEIRKDYIQEKYVIIAPQRSARPRDIRDGFKASKPRLKNVCVFCPESVNKQRAVLSLSARAGSKEWLVKVVSNKYPAVSLNNPKAYGIQEIVIETPDHTEEIDSLSTPHIAAILEVYAARTAEITKNPKIEYVLIFKNQGGRAGASLVHSHSQIFATAFIPPQLIDKARRAQEYKLKNGTCVYCDVMQKEKNSPRLIYKDQRVMAFAPWASVHNYEAWIMPWRHLDNITDLNKQERLSWAKTLKKILQKISQLELPYNYYFHQVVHDEDQHFYMKITPRGSVWAGVEIGSGIVINPIPPEDAAKFYRV